MKAFIAAAVLAAALLTCSTPAHAVEPWTVDDTLMALEGSPPVVACIVFHESGYNPYAVGSSGEQGPIQLLPPPNGGQWNDYLYGDWVALDPAYRSVYDPFLAVRYLEHWGATHGWTFYPWHAWEVYC